MGKIVRPKIQEMPRSIDRCSFVYLDQASINVDGGSIVAWREGKKLVIPAASIVTVVLGPGSKITHDAIKLLGGVGTCVVWMGADQTRFYAAGRPLSSSSKLVEAQARIVSNSKKRLECAKKMYGLRFPGVDCSSKRTMQSLRGMEGSRMREVYKREAARNGITWSIRAAQFDWIDDKAKALSDAESIVNRSLTIGNQILYSVLLGLLSNFGMSPGLGVIHCGRSESLLYDLADLYKVDVTIPIAFKVAKEMGDRRDDLKTIDRKTRTMIREKFVEMKILKKMVADIKYLFLNEDEPISDELAFEELIWIDEQGGLWTKDGVIPGSVNYSYGDLSGDMVEDEFV